MTGLLQKNAVHAMKTTFGVEFSTKRGLNFNIENP